MDCVHALDSEGGKPDAVRDRPAPAVYVASADVGGVAARRKKRNARQFWTKQLHSWHWISAAVSLIGMFLFAVTGITLNHAGSISAEPRIVAQEAVLPPPLLNVLNKPAAAEAPLPAAVSDELEDLVDLDSRGVAAEWSDDEVYVAMPGPGSDAWISIDRASGAVTAEHIDRGWVSYLNDLHKGRNTGTAWFWFIDVFAVASIIFTVTGLVLLQLHAKRRPSTWPLVIVGGAIPIIIAMFFLHI